MLTTTLESLTIGGLRGARRRPVVMSAGGLVTTGCLKTDNLLPLVVQPSVPGLHLVPWAQSNKGFIEERLLRHGGLLFRKFEVGGVADFEKFIRAISGEPLEYKERSSPRHQVSGNIYTSTDYPPDQKIFVHNENSYQKVWPRKIFFYCDTPSQAGGETPIVSCRNVTRRIPVAVRERFAEKNWMYVRNFGDGFGLPWQTVFQSTDRETVQAHCQRNGIDAHWKPGDRLRTSAVRPATANHHHTGEPLWFNHATFFHVTTLEPTIRQLLLSEFDEEDLPINSYYGDGSRIEDSVMDELRGIYLEEEVKFPWQKGDVLILDNMLAAHGRESFAGQRKILVGMSEPYTREQE
ncbi:MAG TPA: TauD/TfdA family dioxygenase [Pyrinomonadaceae bacterium]